MTITSGSVEYTRTIKTGDYENAKASVRLDFNVAEGADHTKTMATAAAQAHAKAHEMLGLKVDRVAQTLAAMPPAPAQPALPSPAAVPLTGTEGPPDRRKPGRPAGSKNKPDPAPAAAADVELPEADDGLADILGEEPPERPPVKEVTDKELTEAITAVNARIKNAAAIRAVIGEFIAPPGKASQIEQSKRAEFLAKLNGLKPATA